MLKDFSSPELFVERRHKPSSRRGKPAAAKTVGGALSRSAAERPERTSPEQGLENAQNGKGWLLAKVGMRLGSAPRSLDVGARRPPFRGDEKPKFHERHGLLDARVRGTAGPGMTLISRPPFDARPSPRSPRIGFPTSWRAHWCCPR